MLIKGGLYTEGKGYKGNIDSSNPCYSFHYLGNSDRLYVFEAPIDMLSFITPHKNSDWKEHSYVALCGLSEQALFRTLESNSQLLHVILCLDHDSAGIETSEKIKDMLAEKKIRCSQLQSQCKDWNEDLKASQSLTVIPAEEHPQHQLKNLLCEEILLLIKQIDYINLRHSDGENALQQAQKQNETQAEAMKMASAIFLSLALKEHRQSGMKLKAEEIVQSLGGQFRAYQNRSRWDPSLLEVKERFLRIEKARVIVTESEKVNIANEYKEVALELLKSMIKLELTEQRLIQTQSLRMA